MSPQAPPSADGSLRRQLGLAAAVVLGLGGMVGTGVFVVAGPAAAVAGRYVALGLVVAGLVAACNATSAARLAARYPVSGGAYHWGRALIHPVAGSLAGWCFVVGKIASAAAAALTVGAYLGRLAGIDTETAVTVVSLLAVVAFTVANLTGITRTAVASAVLVGGVVGVLVGVSLAALGGSGDGASPAAAVGDAPDPARSPLLSVGIAAGLFFLAFAGYARIATLGEEVRRPRRTIPLAIAIAFVCSALLYALVLAAGLRVLGYDALGESLTPVADVAARVPLASVWLVAVPVAATAASAAVALGVQAGISRVLLAMSRVGEVPGLLSRVHPRWSTPWVCDLTAGAAVLVVVGVARLFPDVGAVVTVAVSAASVLIYYAVANLAALRLPGESVGMGALNRLVPVVGVVGCVGLAACLAWWGLG